MSILDTIASHLTDKTIRVTCEGSFSVNIDDLHELHSYKDLTEEAYQRAKTSILELGFSFPIFVWVDSLNQHYIIDAHQRKRVLTRMRDMEGYTIPLLPAVKIHAKDKVEAKKKILAQESQYGDITEEGLYEFINEEGFELDPEELDSFVDIDEFDFEYGETPEAVEDEAPAVSSEPAKSELGKVYQLGRHRLMCGDATKIEDVERLIDGQEPVSMVFTDPPYGISIVGSTGGVGGGTEGKYRPVLGDDSIQTAVDAYNLLSSMGIPKLIFWGGNYYANALPNSSCWLVWDKQAGKQVTFADCELAWTNFDSPVRMYTHIWDGFRRDSEQGETRVHPTQKPIALLAHIMKDYGAENDRVLDVFGGSGSTLIACEQTNRDCYMMELDPKYVDVIRKRYAKFIGKEDEWETLTPSIE